MARLSDYLLYKPLAQRAEEEARKQREDDANRAIAQLPTTLKTLLRQGAGRVKLEPKPRTRTRKKTQNQVVNRFAVTQLKKFLESSGMSPPKFAEETGLLDAQTVRRFLRYEPVRQRTVEIIAKTVARLWKIPMEKILAP